MSSFLPTMYHAYGSLFKFCSFFNSSLLSWKRFTFEMLSVHFSSLDNIRDGSTQSSLVCEG